MILAGIQGFKVWIPDYTLGNDDFSRYLNSLKPNWIPGLTSFVAPWLCAIKGSAFDPHVSIICLAPVRDAHSSH